MSDEEMSVALLESLQRANPVPLGEVAGRRDLPSAHALLAEITAQRPRRFRRRTVVVVIALIVLALAAALGAFALVHRDEPTVVGSVECFPSARYPGLEGYVAPSGGDPIAACEAPWRNGKFGTDGPQHGLDACVLPTGVVGVFPGEYGSVCRQLGFPSARSNPNLEKLEAFQIETAKAVRANCIGYDDARAIVERKLDEYGYTGWTIKLRTDTVPYSDENPCSSMYFEPEHRLAYIVPIEPKRPDQPVPTTDGAFKRSRAPR